MGLSSPSETASGFPARRVWLALLASLPGGLCALGAFIAASAYSLPDVRPAYPTARLINLQTAWDVRGFHTLRTYQVPSVSMRDVLEWYFNEDILARYGPQTQDPATFDYVFSSPSPAHPLAKMILARYSQVNFVSHSGYIEVVTDTHFYWRTLN